MRTPFFYFKPLRKARTEADQHRWQLSLIKLCNTLLLSFTLVTSANANPPQRIVSLNLCTDLLLLQLVEPQRIAGLSHLASEPQYSPLWQQAKHLPQHSGLAEEVIALQPDLILAPQHMRGARPLLARTGYPIADIQLAQNLNDIYETTLELGRLTATERRAEALVKTLKNRVAQSRENNAGQGLSALIYAPNGHTSGRHTFRHEILSVAGYRNTAADIGIEHYGNLSIEQVLHAAPELIIIDDSTDNQASLAQKFTGHPVMKKLDFARFITVHSGLWLCASPLVTQVLDALEQAALEQAAWEQTKRQSHRIPQGLNAQ